jgi:hypothetical protein
MGVNKVICKNEVIMDITSSTVTEDSLKCGITAFNASGDKIVGTLAVDDSSFANWITDPINTTLKLPEGIESIYENTFNGTSALRTIELPDSLQTIGVQAFRGCYNLAQELNLKNVTHIGGGAFRDCSLITNFIFNKVEDIGDTVFRGCTGLTNITFSGSLNALRASAFMNCTNLKTVTFEAGTQKHPTGTMGVNIFEGCSALTDIYVYWSSADSRINAPWGAPIGCKIHYTDKTMQVASGNTLVDVTN